MTQKENRYGVIYPDGSETGAITDKFGLAQNYAKQHGATVHDYRDNGDPIQKTDPDPKNWSRWEDAVHQGGRDA